MNRREYLERHANGALWVQLLRAANEWRRHVAWCAQCRYTAGQR